MARLLLSDIVIWELAPECTTLDAEEASHWSSTLVVITIQPTCHNHSHRWKLNVGNMPKRLIRLGTSSPDFSFSHKRMGMMNINAQAVVSHRSWQYCSQPIRAITSAVGHTGYARARAFPSSNCFAAGRRLFSCFLPSSTFPINSLLSGFARYFYGLTFRGPSRLFI